MIRLCAALATGLTMPSLAAAADAVPRTGGGLRLWAGLIIVMAVILLLYAAARRWLSWPAGGRQGTIQIRETRALGPKKSLCLVRVRDREMLLGVSGDRIDLLCELPAPAREESQTGFEQTLRKQVKDPS